MICLVSALAFHGITDQLLKKVWMAIGRNDWTPKPSDVPIRVLRFSDDLQIESVEAHVDLAVAIEGLQEALGHRKAPPAEIARAADTGGVGTVIRPDLEALTTNGSPTPKAAPPMPCSPPLAINSAV